MREFVRRQTGMLLRRLASQVNRASSSADADAVHDLRVSIRRLSRCLRAFAQFYPGRSWKRIRRSLAALMDLCANVRDRDVAIALLGKAGVPAISPAVRQLDTQRQAAGEELQRELRCWKQQAFSRRWRQRLEL
jgi:CHAD domain-containing protein